MTSPPDPLSLRGKMKERGKVFERGLRPLSLRTPYGKNIKTPLCPPLQKGDDIIATEPRSFYTGRVTYL